VGAWGGEAGEIETHSVPSRAARHEATTAGLAERIVAFGCGFAVGFGRFVVGFGGFCGFLRNSNGG